MRRNRPRLNCGLSDTSPSSIIALRILRNRHVRYRSSRNAWHPRGGAALRGDHLSLGVPAVPGAADHRETDPAVVRRLLGRVDHSAGVLPVDVAGRIRVCRPDAATRCSAANAAAHLAAAAIGAFAADPCVCRVEAPGRRGANRTHLVASAGDDRSAVLSAINDDAVAAGVVLAPLPNGCPLPPLRAVELRVTARTAGFPRAVRALAVITATRVYVVVPLPGLHRGLHADRRNVAEIVGDRRREGGRRIRGDAGSRTFSCDAYRMVRAGGDGLGDAACSD